MLTDINKDELIKNYITQGKSPEEIKGFVDGLNTGIAEMRRYYASKDERPIRMANG